MRSDIVVPKADHLHMAAFQEWNEELDAQVWYVYLVNPTEMTFEQLLVVSKAFGIKNKEQVTTSRLRHGYAQLPPKTAIRVEMLTEEVLPLQNEFMLTYFYENTLYDRTFVFKPNSINVKATRTIEVIEKMGVKAV